MDSSTQQRKGGGDGRTESAFFQNVVVMRHGDRLDNFEPMWVKTADKPWDPPLTDDGVVRAFTTGCKFRDLAYPIHRVFVSPFLRCVQTASQVVSALCAVGETPTADSISAAAIDPSRVKVSIEYGLCEMLNSVAIRKGYAPDDGIFAFKLSELEKQFPVGTVDDSVERIYEGMPRWGESTDDARRRYQRTIRALADRYPCENILFVTHGEAVGVSVRQFLEEFDVMEVEYCAYVELGRHVFRQENQVSIENFQVATHPIKTGIQLIKLN